MSQIEKLASPSKFSSTNRHSSAKKQNKSNFSDDSSYDFILPETYHPKSNNRPKLFKSEKLNTGVIVNYYENEKREFIFPSGNRKEIFSDGYQIMYFYNKDIKQVK